MAYTFVIAFKKPPPSASLALVLFLANSLGYFLGSALNDAFVRPTGMLLWGGVYGLCLGAGLGTVLFLAQPENAPERVH